MTEPQFIKAAKKLNFKVKEVFINLEDKIEVYYTYHYMYNLITMPPCENEWRYFAQSLVGNDFQSIYNEMVEITTSDIFQNLLILKPIPFYE